MSIGFSGSSTGGGLSGLGGSTGVIGSSDG